MLVALPGPDDLVELRGRGIATGGADGGDVRGGGVRLVEQRRATTTAELDAGLVQDVLHSIYRPRRASEQLESGRRVTFSLDLLLFRATG